MRKSPFFRPDLTLSLSRVWLEAYNGENGNSILEFRSEACCPTWNSKKEADLPTSPLLLTNNWNGERKRMRISKEELRASHSRHTCYISVSIRGYMLSELHVDCRVETHFRKWSEITTEERISKKAAVLFWSTTTLTALCLEVWSLNWPN